MFTPPAISHITFLTAVHQIHAHFPSPQQFKAKSEIQSKQQ